MIVAGLIGFLLGMHFVLGVWEWARWQERREKRRDRI